MVYLTPVVNAGTSILRPDDNPRIASEECIAVDRVRSSFPTDLNELSQAGSQEAMQR
jgi:hypothetical protein